MRYSNSGEANQERDMDVKSTRLSWYREQGWWQDERLETRYKRIVDRCPDGLAVADNRGDKLTHKQLWQRSGELAIMLEDRGFSAGDRILVYIPNWAVWQVVFLAILRIRAVPAHIPITTDSGTLAYVLGLIRSTLLITGDIHGTQNLAQTALSAVNQCEKTPALLTISGQGDFSWADKPCKSRNFAPAIADLDHVMFTSSTTGKPKAVMHSTNTLAALNQTFSERFCLGPDQPIFMASPLGHSVGAYHGARLAMFTGAPLVLQERWDPQSALRMIDEFGCAFTAAATPFLRDLVDQPWSGDTPKLASMSTFLCGGAPVPPVLLEQAREQFPNTFVTNLWGMTEGGLVTSVRDSPREKVNSTAGIGLPGLELLIIDRNGKEMGVGEEGELVMRGPGVFIGYMGQEALYDSLMTAAGFFRTEDLARIDEDGYVKITGRLKDLIIRGGVNISPIPIENVLARHPNVLNVAVIGLPDERLGERICAVIVPKGEKPGAEVLKQFALEKGLVKRHCPEIVRYVKKMPRTAGGKIRKADLREIIIKGYPEYRGD